MRRSRPSIAPDRVAEQVAICRHRDRFLPAGFRDAIDADKLDAVACSHPGIAGHATNCVEAGRIDAEVFEQVLPHVEADHLTENDDAARRLVAGVDDLEQFALHLRGRLGHTGRLDYFAGDGCEAGELELVDLGRHFSGCGVCLVGDAFVDDVDDELTGGFDVAEGVFALGGMSAGCAQSGAEEDGGRSGTYPGEEAEGGRGWRCLGIDRGYQGDGAGHDDAGHQLVDLALRVLRGINREHGGTYVIHTLIA